MSSALLALHADVLRAAGAGDDPPHLLPGRWTPHVTLARRVALADVDRAVALATALAQGEAPAGMRVVASAVRRWDGSRRVEWEVGRAQT